MGEQQKLQQDLYQDSHDPDFVAWHGTAQQMTGWHPVLRERAKKQLIAHGLSHLVEVPSEGGEILPLVEGSPTPEAISSAFDKANTVLMKMTRDPRFDVACLNNSVQPFDTENAKYWSTLEEYALAHTAEMRKSEKVSNLTLNALELLAATPNFLVKSSRIKSGKALRGASQHERDMDEDGRDTLRRFKERVRMFANDFPNTRVSDMERALLVTANAADLEESNLARNVNGKIHTVLHDAQYKVAFEQILKTLGIPYRAARAEKKEGIDWVITNGTTPVQYLAIRASIGEIDDLNGGHNNTPYHVRGNRVDLYPLLIDTQLNNTFRISEATAQRTAPEIGRFLAQARNEKSALIYSA